MNKSFVGGCDILMSMHQNGELAKMLEQEKVLVEGGEEDASSASSASSPSSKGGGESS